jgi:mxaA protein
MRRAFLALALTLGFIGVAGAEPMSARLYADRSFGFFVGDVAKARVEIVAEQGFRLQNASLPLPGPLSYWLDLRDISVAQERAGQGLTRWRIELTYQIFYVALDVRDLEIPGFSLRFAGGAGAEIIQSPAWKIGVSPLREVLPQKRDDPTDYMRPDSLVVPIDVATPTQWAGALAASTLAALIAVARDRGWPPFHHRRARVFASAARRLAALARRGDEASQREALLSLHRALDVAAGRRLFAEDLDDFLAHRREFAPQHSGLRQFFAASRRTFFDAGEETAAPLAELAALAKRLADCERSAP